MRGSYAFECVLAGAQGTDEISLHARAISRLQVSDTLSMVDLFAMDGG
jgi:hypothetical protein